MSKPEVMELKPLLECCISENHRYKKTGQSDPSYCYELFRRAFAENDNDTFNALYKAYKPEIEAWAKGHSLSGKLDTPTDVFAGESLLRAWQYLHGEQFQKVSIYPERIKYLKITLNTLMLSEYRK